MLGAACLIGVLSVPLPSAAASRQVAFQCPGETTKSLKLAPSDGSVDVRVGRDCICADTRAILDTGVEAATRGLTLKAIGARYECHYCGAELRETARFCHGCGEKLDTYPPVRSGFVRCPACGEPVKPKADDLAGTSCTACGTILRQHLDEFWDRLADSSSLVRLSGQALPPAGQRSSVKLYCHDKSAIYLYWKKVLRAELGQ